MKVVVFQKEKFFFFWFFLWREKYRLSRYVISITAGFIGKKISFRIFLSRLKKGEGGLGLFSVSLDLIIYKAKRKHHTKGVV